MTYIFFSSQAVAYFSSVVMLISWPWEMGMSASPTVLPVRISGPFCCTDQHHEGIDFDWGSILYCIQGNGQRTARYLALGFSRVVDDRLMVFVCPMGEVHAHDVESSLT